MAAASRFVLAALVNAAWQALLIFLVALAAAWLVRKSPSRQHAVWLIAFALCCLTPLASSLRHYRGAPTVPVTRPLGPLRRMSPAHRPAPFSPDSTAGQAILAVYLITVLWATARLLCSWRHTRNAVASASAAILPPSPAATLANCLGRLGVAAPDVLRSSTSPAPFTSRILRPVIVLPEDILENGSEEVLISVLGHEAAHIRRRDFLSNAMVESLFPLLAFHPSAHWIRRRIRAAREFACDDLVAGHVLEGTRYAASLLAVALKTASAPAPSPSLGAAGSGGLEERIRRLVAPPGHSKIPPVWSMAIVAALFLSVCAATAAYSFQLSDPRDYIGVWRENWAAGHMKPPVDIGDCCFQTLEIRYGNGRFSGTLTTDSADTQGGRIVRANTRSQPILDPLLENGILSFRQRFGGRDQIYEVTMDQIGRALVRSHMVQVVEGWTPFDRVH